MGSHLSVPMTPEKKPQLGANSEFRMSASRTKSSYGWVSIQTVMEGERDPLGVLSFLVLIFYLNLIEKEGVNGVEWKGVLSKFF